MICENCGKELKENAKFCSGCGNPVRITPNGKQESHIEVEQSWDEPEILRSKKKKKSIIPKIIIGFLIIIILGVAAFCVYHFWLKDKISNDSLVESIVDSSEEGDSISLDDEKNTEEDVLEIKIQGSESTTEGVDESTVASTESGESSVAEGEDNTISIAETTDTGSSEMTMKNVDNSSCNINNNLTKNDFQYAESPDGSFSFYYPKYLYNHFEYTDEDGFYFSYEENGNTICSLHVYTKTRTGNPVDNAKQIVKELKKEYDKVNYLWPDDIEKKGVGEDGIMQVVISGWTDAAKSNCKYMLAGNDGSKTYYLETTYPEGDIKDETEAWDYIVDTLYRYCSFSGTTKAPYTNYNAFKKEMSDE